MFNHVIYSNGNWPSIMLMSNEIYLLVPPGS